ncbi:MAG: DUF99 family protein [Candidatus Micrarchaeaceae archaeon]
MKSGARFIAIASGPISKKLKNNKTILVGIIFRENYIEGLLSTRISVDGTDSTNQIIGMINKSRFKDQIRILLFNGIALAGLNIINPNFLEKKLKMKIILLNKRRQNAKELVNALNEFSRIHKKDASERIKIVKNYSSVKILKVRHLFFQSKLESHYLKNFSDNAFEALRIAHIVASGISSGESKGRL